MVCLKSYVVAIIRVDSGGDSDLSANNRAIKRPRQDDVQLRRLNDVVSDASGEVDRKVECVTWRDPENRTQ